MESLNGTGSHTEVVAGPLPLLSVLVMIENEQYHSSLRLILEDIPQVGCVTICRTPEELYWFNGSRNSILISCLNSFAVTGPHQCPLVIAGSTNEEALKAFAINAGGFISMPPSKENVRSCLQHQHALFSARTERAGYESACKTISLQAGISVSALKARLNRQLNHPGFERRLSLRCAGEWTYLEYGDIIWIEAAGDYLVVHCLSENHVVRCSLCDMQRKLPDQFTRISRSAIINCTAIVRIDECCRRPRFIHLSGNIKLNISQHYAMRTSLINTSN